MIQIGQTMLCEYLAFLYRNMLIVHKRRNALIAVEH